MSDVDCSRVSSVSFFFSSPPHVIKGAARGGLYMCVKLVGKRVPPHSTCGPLDPDR